MTNGFLLAIEGIDGSGKNSLASLIAARSSAVGREADCLSFPNYSTPTGKAIASHLSGSGPTLSAEAAAVLFATNRLERRDEITAALARGNLVIVDRYVASNAAYQSGRIPSNTQGVFAQWVEDLEYGLFGMPQPNLTIFLDVSTSDSRSRTSLRDLSGGRPAGDLYESSARLLDSAAETYRLYSRSDSWVTIDASSNDIPAVAEIAWQSILRAAES